MIYAVISDIHANETALRKVLDDAKAQGAQRIVCLGDVVGYGPQPLETIKLLQLENAIMIAGNHDDAVAGRVSEGDFIDLARDAVLRHREALGAKMCNFLASLPYTVEFGEAIASHGDFTVPEKFFYIENEEDARANFNAINSRLAFVGHTHNPNIFLTGQSGAIYKIDPQDFIVEDDKRYIVNPGSVGYPREKDGQCFSSYVLYDDEERSVTFRSLPFAISSVMQRGESSSNSKKRFLGIIMTAVLALMAIFVLYIVFNKEDGVSKINISAVDQLILEEKTLKMSPEMKYLGLNLVLDNKAGFAPVNVKIEFLDEVGRVVEEDSKTVKLSSRALSDIKVKTRDKAKRVKITLMKQKREDNVKIIEFAPFLSVEKKRL